MCSLLCSAGGKKKPEPYAIIAGTVFQESGFSLRGANVVLTLQGDPKAKKLQEAVSDVRGEFAFHVPAKPAAYMVKASLKGYRPEEKQATVSGEERIDVTLTLVQESK